MNLPVLSVSVKQAELITGIGKTTIYEAINKGELEAKKPNRNIVISVKALEAWVDSLPSATQ